MKTTATRRPASKRRAAPRRGSGRVTRTSHALDLEPGVFKGTGPKKIAASLKRSAQRSRRKDDPYRSAVSMITFYMNLNHAGRNLAPRQRSVLQRAKVELRQQFGREE